MLIMLIFTRKETRNTILFIDELDVFGSRSSVTELPPGYNTVLTALLGHVQHIRDNYNNITVIGATNTPDKCDVSLIRAGRFGDQYITIQNPNDSSRGLGLAVEQYFRRRN